MMKTKKLYYLILPVVTLILETLPYGAVCNFALDGGEVRRKTYSYFSLIPYGYANFTPFLTALLTCAVLLMLLVYCFTGKKSKAVRIVLCAAVVLSLCPLVLGLNCFSVVGLMITVTLIAELLLIMLTDKK